MSNDTDRSRPLFERTVEPDDIDRDVAKPDQGDATGDQVGGQSSHSEDEIADRDRGDEEGEDEGSSANEGRDDHLKNEQKPIDI